MDEVTIMEKYFFNKLLIEKNSVVFTWDDNFSAHFEIIAPIFLEFKYRCSFYINPGEIDFIKKYYRGYKTIHDVNFEIGSHGYTHHHFSKYDNTAYSYQLSKSKEIIKEYFGTNPTTFAFPHHDFTEEMLKRAKYFYFETRNTLSYSKRFSLKTNSSIEQIKSALEDTCENGQDLIFSGHSISNKLHSIEECGYEPISIRFLINILYFLSENQNIQVCTFEEACLKNYIKYNCFHTNTMFELNKSDLEYLEKYGLGKERILEII